MTLFCDVAKGVDLVVSELVIALGLRSLVLAVCSGGLGLDHLIVRRACRRVTTA